MNRKLETEEEKVLSLSHSLLNNNFLQVLPFYTTSLTPEEEEHISALQDRKDDEDGLTGVSI